MPAGKVCHLRIDEVVYQTSLRTIHSGNTGGDVYRGEKAMKTLVWPLVAGLFLAAGASLGAQDRAHQLAQQAASQHPATCPSGSLTLQECHDQFPDGCSASAHPSYDAYLDFLKDQDPDPGLAPTKELASADFQNLESQLSHLSQTSKRRGRAKKGGLTSSNHASFATQFAGLGEGNLYAVIAYLYFAEDTGNPAPGGSPNIETCNCKLKAPNTFDYHIGIGFDAALANQALANHPKPGDPLYSQLQKNSVVAEMTPYPRTTRHPNWGIDNVAALQGKQVKVVGQLMVDNEHFNAKDDCAFPAATTKCWRSTVWEIHPIAKLYTCNLSSPCDGSSPDSAWTDLDQP